MLQWPRAMAAARTQEQECKGCVCMCVCVCVRVCVCRGQWGWGTEWVLLCLHPAPEVLEVQINLVTRESGVIFTWISCPEDVDWGSVTGSCPCQVSKSPAFYHKRGNRIQCRARFQEFISCLCHLLSYVALSKVPELSSASVSSSVEWGQ